jgi:hypothetical protein
MKHEIVDKIEQAELNNNRRSEDPNKHKIFIPYVFIYMQDV